VIRPYHATSGIILESRDLSDRRIKKCKRQVAQINGRTKKNEPFCAVVANVCLVEEDGLDHSATHVDSNNGYPVSLHERRYHHESVSVNTPM
jgi:hypothetical protein